MTTECNTSVIVLLLGVSLSALGLAIARDGSSGGVIRMAVITEKGVTRSVFTGSQIPTFPEF